VRNTIAAAATIALLIGGAAEAGTPSPATAPVSATLPPYAPAYEPRSVDERGLWMETDEYERRLKDSPLLVKDVELQNYVRKVLCETVGDNRCGSVRIYILEVPALNASMTPNGALTVWTGLLLRAQNEAQLGAVLGHEFAHFELRHTLSAFKQRRKATDLLAWAQVLGGLTNTDTTGLQLSLIGSMFRYSRDEEKQADLLALKYLAASPYPSSEFARIWQNMMAEEDATAAGRKVKSKHRYTAGFFDDHPTDLDRANYLASAAQAMGDSGDPQVAGHYAAIGHILPRLLADQTKLNDFGGSDYILNEMAALHGWTPDLLFARGQMYTLRGNPRDLLTASQFYRQALNGGLNDPVAHRELGLTLLKSGSAGEAKPEFEKYLQLVPGASDARVIKTLLSE